MARSSSSQNPGSETRRKRSHHEANPDGDGARGAVSSPHGRCAGPQVRRAVLPAIPRAGKPDRRPDPRARAEARHEAAIEQYAKALEIDPGMRDVRRNPLVVDTRLLGRVSVANYSKDMARAGLRNQAAWADEPRFRRVPVDRPLFSDDMTDSLSP